MGLRFYLMLYIGFILNAFFTVYLALYTFFSIRQNLAYLEHHDNLLINSFVGRLINIVLEKSKIEFILNVLSKDIDFISATLYDRHNKALKILAKRKKKRRNACFCAPCFLHPTGSFLSDLRVSFHFRQKTHFQCSVPRSILCASCILSFSFYNLFARFC